MRFDPQFKLEPDLAVSWTAWSPTAWKFKLREGVTFTDGSPFTADDVVFSLGRIPTVLNSPSSFNFSVKPISRIEVIDPQTLRFHTTQPQPLMAYNLASVRIVSRKGGEGAGTGDYNNPKAAIGIGPYRVTEFVVDLYRQVIREAMPDQPVIPLHHQVDVWALRKGLVMRQRMQEGIRAWEVRPE